MTKVTADNIESWYAKHRLDHADAISWDEVIYYKLNGGLLGQKLKTWEWVELMKCAHNTVIKWLPLIQEYIHKNGILKESVGDAIVQANITKQKGQTK